MGNPSETVLHVHSIKARDFIPVKGILDSGATQDWISRDLVVRLGATSVALAEPTVFEDFQGGTLRAESRVQLRWHGNRSLRTREGCFLVAETGPFDIVIGSDFLFAEGVFTFNEAALMNHQRPLKQEQQKQGEGFMKEQEEDEKKRLKEKEDAKKAKDEEASKASSSQEPSSGGAPQK